MTWTIAHYVMLKQPDVYETLIRIFHVNLPELEITFVPEAEDELTPEQRVLERIMKQAPRPGIAGALPGEGD